GGFGSRPGSGFDEWDLYRPETDRARGYSTRRNPSVGRRRISLGDGSHAGRGADCNPVFKRAFNSADNVSVLAWRFTSLRQSSQYAGSLSVFELRENSMRGLCAGAEQAGREDACVLFRL